MSDYSDLLIWQYKDKPKALATVKGLCKIADETRAGFFQLMEVLDINTAVGMSLDFIGLHVGLSRYLPNLSPLKLFGMTKSGVGPAGGFGKNQKLGSRFWRSGTALTTSARLEDPEYRFLLKAVIAKYNNDGTILELQEAFEALVGAGEGTVHDQQDMSITLNVYRQLTSFEKYVLLELDMLPRPPAVKISRVVQMSDKSFGFVGSKNVAPMGEGKFARVIL